MVGSRRARSALAALVLVCSATLARSADDAEILRVGIYEDPPFAMKDAGGRWNGIAIELWHRVADDLGLDYELREYASPAAVFRAIGKGEIDAFAGAVPVSSARFEDVEFTTPFLSKSFSIATVPANAAGWLDSIVGHLSPRLGYTLAALVVLFAVASIGIWWIERHRNPEHFGGSPARGIAEGFWWAAATVTTVGYGDRTPVTLFGRLFAVAVMLAALVLVSLVTGIIASQLTVHELHARIRGLADLARVRVGVVEESPVEEFLVERGIRPVRFADVPPALDALVAGQIDAVVAGEPELRYHARGDFEERIAIVPGALDRGFLAFVLPSGSPLRRPLNAAIARELEGPFWARLVEQHLDRRE